MKDLYLFAEFRESIIAEKASIALLEPLAESQAQAITDETGTYWEVCVIKAGVSINGNLYERSVLEDACALFEGAPVGLYQFGPSVPSQPQDHIPDHIRNVFPNGLALNVAGWIENVRMVGDEMIANLRVTNEWLRKTLLESHSKGNPNLLELSIEARGSAEKVTLPTGKVVRKVTKITEANELTVVTRGSAGGKFKRILASTAPQNDGLEIAVGAGKYHVLRGSELISTHKTKEAAIQCVYTIRGMIMDKSEEPTQEVSEIPKEIEEISEISSIEEGVQDTPVEIEASEELPVSVSEEKPLDPQEYIIAEAPKVRQGLVRAIRAMGFEESLDEATTKEILDMLHTQIGTFSKEQEDSSLEESLQNTLLQVLECLKMGNFERTTAAIESVLSVVQEGVCAKKRRNPKSMKEAKKVEEEKNELDSRLAEAREMLLASKATLLETELGNSGLPDSVQDLIRSQEEFKGDFSVKSLKECIAGHKKVWSDLLPKPSNEPLTPAKAVSVSMGHGRIDRAKAEINVLCGYKPEKDSSLKESDRELYKNVDMVPSLREWYMNVTDDRNFNCRQVGPNAILREATSSSVAELMGDALNRTLAQAYEAQSKVWQQVAEVKSIKDFRSQKRIITGGLGILPVVAESDSADTYERLGLGADEQTTYVPNTVGGLVAVTRKMIINDDLDGLRRIPMEMAESASSLLQTRVFASILGNIGGAGINTDLSYDGVQIYHNNHVNKGTAAMAYTPLFDSMNRLRRQRKFANVGATAASIADNVVTSVTVATTHDFWTAVKVGDQIRVEAERMLVTAKPSSGVFTVTRGYGGTTAAAHTTVGTRVEQVGVPINVLGQGMTLLYPYALESTAAALLRSEKVPGSNNNDRNEIYALVSSGIIKPLGVDEYFLGEDTNNWYMIAGRPVEVGVIGGSLTPTFITANGETDYPMLMRDNYTWKGRQEYGVGIPDHKFVDGNIVP